MTHRDPYFSRDDDEVVKAYREQFKLKRREKEKLALQAVARRERVDYKIMRFVSMPLVLVGAFLIMDQLLPGRKLDEFAIEGYQEKAGRRLYRSYMVTESVVVQVPNVMHVNYPYYDKTKEKVTITLSPILQIPKSITVPTKDAVYKSEVPGTIYSSLIPFHWLLFVSALFTAYRKEYSRLNYSLCFLPVLLFCFLLLKWN